MSDSVKGAPVGDTIVLAADVEKVPALPGFEKVRPQVYAGMFTVSSDDFDNFRDALEKLTLNDASLVYEHGAFVGEKEDSANRTDHHRKCATFDEWPT